MQILQFASGLFYINKLNNYVYKSIIRCFSTYFKTTYAPHPSAAQHLPRVVLFTYDIFRRA